MSRQLAEDIFGGIICILALAALIAEVYQNGGWWAVLMAVVIIGGMAS